MPTTLDIVKNTLKNAGITLPEKSNQNKIDVSSFISKPTISSQSSSTINVSDFIKSSTETPLQKREGIDVSSFLPSSVKKSTPTISQETFSDKKLFSKEGVKTTLKEGKNELIDLGKGLFHLGKKGLKSLWDYGVKYPIQEQNRARAVITAPDLSQKEKEEELEKISQEFKGKSITDQLWATLAIAKDGVVPFIDTIETMVTEPRKVIEDFKKFKNVSYEDKRKVFEEVAIETVSSEEIPPMAKFLGTTGFALAESYLTQGGNPKEYFMDQPIDSVLNVTIVGGPLKKFLKYFNEIEKVEKTKNAIKATMSEANATTVAVMEATADVLRTADSSFARKTGDLLKRITNKETINKIDEAASGIENAAILEKLKMKKALRGLIGKADDVERQNIIAVVTGIAEPLNKKLADIKDTYIKTIQKPIEGWLVKNGKLTKESATAISYQPILKALGVELVSRMPGGRQVFSKAGQLTREQAARLIEKTKAGELSESLASIEAKLPELKKISASKRIEKMTQEEKLKVLQLDTEVKRIANGVVDDINDQLLTFTKDKTMVPSPKTQIRRGVKSQRRQLQKFDQLGLKGSLPKNMKEILKPEYIKRAYKFETKKGKNAVINRANRVVRQLNDMNFEIPKIREALIKEVVQKTKKTTKINDTVRGAINEIRSEMNAMHSIDKVVSAVRNFPEPAYVSFAKSKNLLADIVDSVKNKFKDSPKVLEVIDSMASDKVLVQGTNVSGLRLTPYKANVLKARTGKSLTPTDFHKQVEQTIDEYVKIKVVDEKLEVLTKYAKKVDPKAPSEPGMLYFSPDVLKKNVAKLDIESEALMGSTPQSVVDNIYKAYGDTIPNIKATKEVFAIPKFLVDELRVFKTKSPTTLGFIKQAFWDTPTDAWRATVLALRPAWTVNDAAGSFTLNWLAGVKTKDYFRLLDKDFRGKIIDDIYFGDLYGVIQEANDLATMPLTKEFGKAIKDKSLIKAGVAAIKIPNRVVKTGYRVNRAVNNFFREANFINALWDEAMNYASKNKIKQTRENMLTIMDNSNLKQNALKRVQNTLPGYQELSLVEKEVVRRILPFYSWLRFMASSGVKLTFSPTGRTRTKLLSIMGEEGAREFEESGKPDYMRSRLQTNLELFGTPVEIDTAGMSIWQTLADLSISRGLHPYIQAYMEQSTKVDTFTKQMFTTPELPTAYDVLAVPFEDRPTPTLKQQITGSIPQLRLLQDLLTPYKKYEATGDVRFDKYGRPDTINRAIKIMNYIGIPLRREEEVAKPAGSQKLDEIKAEIRRAKNLRKQEVFEGKLK